MGMFAVRRNQMKQVFAHPRSLKKAITHYCPGCGHGIAHRLVAETLDELGLRENTVGIAPVGCSVLIYLYMDVDILEAAHGRSPAEASGVKLGDPSKFVFTYQGDGDLAAIGTNELIHTANRGTNISTIFINNAIYGMTGGQMAPTTMIGQKTTTTPAGRDHILDGHPLRVCEMLATLDGVSYLERVSLTSPANVRHAKKAIRKSFRTQIERKGYSLVEILSQCPTGWGLSPVDSLNYVDEEMTKIYPLGVFKDWEKTGGGRKLVGTEAPPDGDEKAGW
jgi:2-oxoglutarate ferredoxin oxidoreductase subunit beta